MSGPDLLETLVSTRHRALAAYAYLLCGNMHDANDLAQDALVKTFTRRRAGLDLDSAEAYVRRAILTTYLDGWRRRRRWGERLHLLAATGSSASPAGESDDRLDVIAALRQLPRQQRACVVLRFYGDLTVAEIAAEIGVGEGTAKRYLSLAVHRLGSILGPLEDSTTEIELIKETGR